MPIPVQLREFEKAASILHLYRPNKGCCHRVAVCNANAGDSPLWGKDDVVKTVGTRASWEFANS